MIKVGIIGGAGYTAGELIRLLLNHPEAEIVFINSASNAGNKITDVHGGLYGETDLTFTDQLPLDEIDVLFFCTAHGDTRKFMESHNVPEDLKIIDLSMDYRLKSDDHDFIYGLPGEGENQVQNDLDWVVRMGLPHASFYSLQLEPHTAFFNAGVKEPSQDVFERDYALICARLAKAGLLRYEVSNFARPGFESRHNLCYWQGDAYAAIGYGASSYVDGVRAVRTRDMAQYLAGNYIFEEQRESLREQEFDYLMCNLRLVKGFSLEDYTARFQRDFRQAYADKIKILGNMLEFGHGRVRVCPRDLYILDSILVDLLDFESIESIGGKEE